MTSPVIIKDEEGLEPSGPAPSSAQRNSLSASPDDLGEWHFRGASDRKLDKGRISIPSSVTSAFEEGLVILPSIAMSCAGPEHDTKILVLVDKSVLNEAAEREAKIIFSAVRRAVTQGMTTEEYFRRLDSKE